MKRMPESRVWGDQSHLQPCQSDKDCEIPGICTVLPCRCSKIQPRKCVFVFEEENVENRQDFIPSLTSTSINSRLLDLDAGIYLHNHPFM